MKNNKGQTVVEYILIVLVLLTVGAVVGPKLFIAIEHKLGYITVDQCVNTVMQNDLERLPAYLR